MKVKHSLFVVGIVGALSISLAAHAQELAPGEGKYIYPDRTTAVVEGNDLLHTISGPFMGHHSYCCDARTASSAHLASFQDVKNGSGQVVPYSQDQGMSSPALSSSWEAGRVCFIADREWVDGDSSLTLWTTDTGDTKTTVECNDTTLAGAFNTFSSDYLFLELAATSSPLTKDTKVSIKLETSDGVITLKETDVLVRTDIPLHDLIPKNAVGTILVSHTNSQNGLKGWIAEYRVDTSNLQSQFTLVGRASLKKLSAN